MTHQVVRGGSFDFNARSVRCAVRGRPVPGSRSGRDGFRVVEEAPVDEAQESTDRVVRGGSFNLDVWYVRCAVRIRSDPGLRNDYSGFRVVEEQ